MYPRSTPGSCLLLLLLSSACSSDSSSPSPSFYCGESRDALLIELTLAEGADVVAGRYALHVEADDDPATECGFAAGEAGSQCMPADDGSGCFATAAEVGCNSTVQLVFGRYLLCETDGAGGVVAGCDEKGPYKELISILGTPAKVVFEQTSPGGGVTTGTFEPHYTTVTPAGAGREPICHLAKVERELL